jgi:hypothetical protein
VGFEWDTSGFGNVLKAQDLNDGFDAIENFVNEGIASKEFKDTVDYTGSSLDPFTKEGFLSSSKIYRPEFYGSPSPRMMAVSGQTHFRETPWAWDNSVAFNPNVTGEGGIGIPSCTTTIKLRHEAIVGLNGNLHVEKYSLQWSHLTSTQWRLAILPKVLLPQMAFFFTQ